MKPSNIDKVVYLPSSMLSCRVAVTTNPKAYAKEHKRLTCGKQPASEFTLDGCGATTHFFVTDGQFESLALMCFKVDGSARTIAEMAAIVAHEVMHAWQECKKRWREEEPGIEVEAYAVQWMVLEVMSLFYPRRSGK